MQAINDSGAIKGLDAREDGVYITYVPASGADPVTKKLGSLDVPPVTITVNAESGDAYCKYLIEQNGKKITEGRMTLKQGGSWLIRSIKIDPDTGNATV